VVVFRTIEHGDAPEVDDSMNDDSMNTVQKTLGICLLCLLSAQCRAQPPQKSRLHGYVGGPYKVALADVTGDKLVDVVLAYRQIGVVAVQRGDGKGQLEPPVLNVFSDEDRRINPDDESWSVPHVHNIAFGDIDSDGLVDLVCGVGGLGTSKPGRVVIARNAGEGRFQHMLEFPTPSQVKGVRFADMNNDGRLDLLYTARGSGYEGDITIGRLYIRQGLGDWKFGPAVVSDAGRSAYFIETADLNNDGFLDVIVPNEHAVTVTYFLHPGKTIFTDAKTLQSRTVSASRIPGQRSHAINDVRAADFNGDGNQDLVTANLGTSTVSIFIGNGDGSFQQDTLIDAGKNGAFLSVGDLDDDGDIDVVITHWTEDFASVFLNKGDGTFHPRKDYTTGSGNYGIDMADLNGDGHLDVVTANYRERSMSLLIGRGDGTFNTSITQPKGLRSRDGRWVPESE
jgi:hypothetical protein